MLAVARNISSFSTSLLRVHRLRFGILTPSSCCHAINAVKQWRRITSVQEQSLPEAGATSAHISRIEAEIAEAQEEIKRTLVQLAAAEANFEKASSDQDKGHWLRKEERLSYDLKHLRGKEEKLCNALARSREQVRQGRDTAIPATMTIAEALERLGPGRGYGRGLHEPQRLVSTVFAGWPTLARDNFFDTVFDAIADRLVAKPRSSDRLSNPHIAIQSSPGGGKSFALDRVASLSPDFITASRVERYLATHPELTADQKEQARQLFNRSTTLSLAVTFNSGTSVSSESFEDDPKMSLISRIVHDYCKSKRQLIETVEVLKRVKNLSTPAVLEAIMAQECQRRGIPEIKLVLLVVDELVKAKNPVAILREVGVALNCETIPFASIVSTLDRFPIYEERKYSGRPIKWGVLTPLPTEQLLSSSLFSRWKDNRVVKMLIEACGGWPRYVQWLYEAIERKETVEDFQLVPILDTLVRNVTEAHTLLSRRVLRPAILRSSVMDNQIPDPAYPNQTYRDLVATGVYTNSLSTEQRYIPKIAPLVLFTLASVEGEYSYEKAVRFIYDALPNADFRSHEKMVYAFEWLRRAVLNDGEILPCTISELFPNALHNDSAETAKLLNLCVRLRGASPAVYNLPDWERLDLKARKDTNCVVRAPPGTAGFDIYTPLEATDGSTVIVVFQCRFSHDEATTVLDRSHLKDIKEASAATVRQRLGVDDSVRIVYVVVAYRNIRPSFSATDVPNEMLVIARDKLEKYFGPSLVQLYKLFALEAWQSR